MYFGSSCVRIVVSEQSGMGKSLYIKHLAEKLQKKLDQASSLHVIIPLHGPVVDTDMVLELLQEHSKKPTTCIYHIEIAPSVSFVS